MANFPRPHPTTLLPRLASQHHTSDYSCAKFGAQGSPVPYLPLSLQHPVYYAQLRAQQLRNAHQRAWWPAPAPAIFPSVSLQDQITAAMSEPLQRSSQAQLKTSHTHPINISYIIPADLIDLISSHALLSHSPLAPTVFEIPHAFTLTRLSVLRDTHLQTLQPPPPFFIPLAPFRTRPNISDALQAAINSGIDTTHDTPPSRFVTEFAPEPNVSVSLSMSIPKLPQLHAEPLRVKPYRPIRDPSVFHIGNLFLSSCPGKKIRLDGPVNGRSGVRRDIETDMMRMTELGVRCIVCCLDNVELGYLGAPWPEYEACAQKIGIDVLRLPIPEGLPPSSAPSLDAHLSDLINRYTMRGVPILVHCRGGVGRAGVVACCWMIRVGLCGWPAPEQDVISFVEKVIILIRRRRSIKALETYEQVKFLVEYVEHLQRKADISHSALIPAQHLYNSSCFAMPTS